MVLELSTSYVLIIICFLKRPVPSAKKKTDVTDIFAGCWNQNFSRCVTCNTACQIDQNGTVCTHGITLDHTHVPIGKDLCNTLEIATFSWKFMRAMQGPCFWDGACSEWAMISVIFASCWQTIEEAQLAEIWALQAFRASSSKWLWMLTFWWNCGSKLGTDDEREGKHNFYSIKRGRELEEEGNSTSEGKPIFSLYKMSQQFQWII